MSTQDNLKEAFAGESQANRKYLAFSKRAEEEGHPQTAKLFRAAAHAETVHALAHLHVLQGVGTTEENLKAAIEGETEEFESMYPGFIEEAKKEDNNKAKLSFMRANAVEKIHAGLFQKLYDNLGQNVSADYYVCEVCGNTVENQAPEKCPICGQSSSVFTKIT